MYLVFTAVNKQECKSDMREIIENDIIDSLLRLPLFVDVIYMLNVLYVLCTIYCGYVEGVFNLHLHFYPRVCTLTVCVLFMVCAQDIHKLCHRLASSNQIFQTLSAGCYERACI